ncbi:MAG: glycosyltransferase family 2 protein [Acetatifactor sp.]|nr:glycosyltransferase family 2 protein [Acetatifactor sp.]
MKVNIVLPVYNRVIQLEKTLYCLRSWTFKDFGVIIVDDGSANDYSKLLADYVDLNIYYVRCRHTANFTFVREKGFKNADGRYIAV